MPATNDLECAAWWNTGTDDGEVDDDDDNNNDNNNNNNNNKNINNKYLCFSVSVKMAVTTDLECVAWYNDNKNIITVTILTKTITISIRDGQHARDQRPRVRGLTRWW